jgi:hypothetical protein
MSRPAVPAAAAGSDRFATGAVATPVATPPAMAAPATRTLARRLGLAPGFETSASSADQAVAVS